MPLSIRALGQRRSPAALRQFGTPIFLAPPPVDVFLSAPLAAAIADGAVALFLAPVDSWKSRAQLDGFFGPGNSQLTPAAKLQRLFNLSSAQASLTHAAPAPKLARAPFRPYRGALVSCAGAALDTLTFVAIYRFLRRAIAAHVHNRNINLAATSSSTLTFAPTSGSNQGHLPNGPHELGDASQSQWRSAIAAGAGASILSAFTSAPFDLVREQLRSGRHAGPLAAIRAAVSGPGSWRGLYVGVVPTIIRDLPFDTFEFMVFETMEARLGLRRQRKWLAELRKCPDAHGGALPPANSKLLLRPIDNLLMGMLTGALVGAIVAPLDLIVTRVLVNPARYKSMLSSIRTIAREEGTRGLLAGTVQKCLRESAASGIFFAASSSLLGAFGIPDSDDPEDDYSSKTKATETASAAL
jgi:Mitochondrial carrier protein